LSIPACEVPAPTNNAENTATNATRTRPIALMVSNYRLTVLVPERLANGLK